MSLSDYRNRHALYKSDPAIQKMHSHCPWILTWDDHEVDNNYANDAPEDKETRTEFLERRGQSRKALEVLKQAWKTREQAAGNH